jgi:hypothetical protein
VRERGNLKKRRKEEPITIEIQDSYYKYKTLVQMKLGVERGILSVSVILDSLK